MEPWVESPAFKLSDRTEELDEGLLEKVDELSFVLGGWRVGVPSVSFVEARAGVVEARGVSGCSKVESRESGGASFGGGTKLAVEAVPWDGSDHLFVSFVLE